MSDAARNFTCPATEEPCTDPTCRLDICREQQRENEAYARSQLARGKLASPDDEFPSETHRRIGWRRGSYSRWRVRRRPNSTDNGKGIAFGILAISLGLLIWLLKLVK